MPLLRRKLKSYKENLMRLKTQKTSSELKKKFRRLKLNLPLKSMKTAELSSFQVRLSPVTHRASSELFWLD